MALAFRARENRRLLQRAWEIRHLLAPHLSREAEISVLSLFDAMPGSFPQDIPKEWRTPKSDDEVPLNLNHEQREEALRRRNKKRVLKPRT
jgi:hypothetical protein